jgi:hypothetical protein
VPRFLSWACLVALLWLAGCGGGGRSSSNSSGNNGSPGGASGSNVQAISVNSGPTGTYANGVFTTVNVCVAGTSNCQAIANVLVDTGSSGLRILSSALTLTGLQAEVSGGNPVVECAQFADGFTWGPVMMVDVKMAGEAASNIPIQVINGNSFPIPTACSNTGPAENDLQHLLANGILGVGLGREDCGGACTTTGTAFYWACSSSTNGCSEIGLPLAQQLQNPVWMFATDNNGVLIQLPALASAAPSVSGSLIFGIETQSNNALNGATVMPVAANGTITTVFNNTNFPNSFIDSGSNGIFFLNTTVSGIPTCASPNADFYCPNGTQNLAATNRGTNGSSKAVAFSVANAQMLFSTGSNAAFSQLAGPNPGIFDWGLPFFFGRSVLTAIEGQSTPGGNGPYFAF